MISCTGVVHSGPGHRPHPTLPATRATAAPYAVTEYVRPPTPPVDPWEGQPYFPGQLPASDEPTDPLPEGKPADARHWMDELTKWCWIFVIVMGSAMILRWMWEHFGVAQIIQQLPTIIPPS